MFKYDNGDGITQRTVKKMKIRVMGTKAECEQAQAFYRQFGNGKNISYCSISGLYPNRGSVNQFRVYVEIICKDESNIYGDMLPQIKDGAK